MREPDPKPGPAGGAARQKAGGLCVSVSGFDRVREYDKMRQAYDKGERIRRKPEGRRES
jgi:hypothetical protein